MGGVVTTFIILIALIFATMKMVQFFTGHNPEISVFTSLGYVQADDKVNLNDINFRMALVVEGFADRKRKADPRYVKYIARIWNEEDGKMFYRHIPMHECSE